jgi:hypothetical protein
MMLTGFVKWSRIRDKAEKGLKMKGFLIFMVLVVGGSIYLFTHTHELLQQAIDAVEKDEGPNDQAFQDQNSSDPVKFADRYRGDLKERVMIVRFDSFLGEDDLTLDLTRKSRDRYDQTSLANDPLYGELLYHLAQAVEDQASAISAPEANDTCKRYLALFPDGKHAIESSAMIQRLAYKFNLH